MNNEQQRLEAARNPNTPWRKWGPYLSERQWGTVREDYSEGGDAWNFFTHDHARARAYRWGGDLTTTIAQAARPMGCLPHTRICQPLGILDVKCSFQNGFSRTC